MWADEARDYRRWVKYPDKTESESAILRVNDWFGQRTLDCEASHLNVEAFVMKALARVETDR